MNKLLTIENKLLLVLGAVYFMAVAGETTLNYYDRRNTEYNGARIDTLQRHNHGMAHNHTVDDTARQYGRVRTGVPDYLAGIGGWY